jgi:hypothetical protein
MSVQEKLNEGIKLLEKRLAGKNCKLSAIRGNGYRVAEGTAKSYPNGVIPATATPAEIADRMYAFVLADVNGIINRTPGSGQLEWEIKPAKLLAFETSKGPGRLASHLPEPKAKRAPESAGTRREAIEKMQRIYDSIALNPNSPRTSLLRAFINEVREEPTFDSAACLKAVKKFADEPKWQRAVQDLQRFLAEERDGGDHSETKHQAPANSAVRDVSEFLA